MRSPRRTGRNSSAVWGSISRFLTFRPTKRSNCLTGGLWCFSTVFVSGMPSPPGSWCWKGTDGLSAKHLAVMPTGGPKRCNNRIRSSDGFRFGRADSVSTVPLSMPPMKSKCFFGGFPRNHGVLEIVEPTQVDYIPVIGNLRHPFSAVR